MNSTERGNIDFRRLVRNQEQLQVFYNKPANGDGVSAVEEVQDVVVVDHWVDADTCLENDLARYATVDPGARYVWVKLDLVGAGGATERAYSMREISNSGKDEGAV